MIVFNLMAMDIYNFGTCWIFFLGTICFKILAVCTSLLFGGNEVKALCKLDLDCVNANMTSLDTILTLKEMDRCTWKYISKLKFICEGLSWMLVIAIFNE